MKKKNKKKIKKPVAFSFKVCYNIDRKKGDKNQIREY